MPIAEIMAGISLVKASVDFIKSNIDTAKDIGEIAGAVDGLFRSLCLAPLLLEVGAPIAQQHLPPY